MISNTKTAFAEAATKGEKFKTVLKGIGAGIEGMSLLGKVSALLLLFSVISQIHSAIQQLEPSIENTAGWLSDSAAKVKQNQDELTKLNKKLETTQSRITELLSLQASGSLTIVEQDELTRLERTNSELRAQIELKKQTLQIAKDEAAVNFEKAVNAKEGANGRDAWGSLGLKQVVKNNDVENFLNDISLGMGVGTTFNRIRGLLHASEEEKENAFDGTDFANAVQEYLKARDEEQKAIDKKDNEAAKKWQESAEKEKNNIIKYGATMSKYLEELGDYDYSELTESQKNAVDQANKAMNVASMVSGDRNTLLGNVFNQQKYESAKKAIDEYVRKNGALTSDALTALKHNNHDVAMMMAEYSQYYVTGAFGANADPFKDFITYVNNAKDKTEALKETAKQATKSFSDLMNAKGTNGSKSFVENMEVYVEKAQKLQDALLKVESGTITNSEKNTLFKTFPELTQYADNLSFGISKLSDSMKEAAKTKLDKKLSELKKSGFSREDIAQYEAWSKNILGIIDAVNSAGTILSSTQSVFKNIDTAIQNYNDKGYFTIENLEALATSGQKYLQYLSYENGQLKINTLAYKKLVNAQIDELETKAVLQATSDLKSLTDEAAAKDYLAKINIDLANSQLTAAEAAFKYQLALKLSKGGNVAAAAQKIANNLGTLKSIFATAREKAISYSDAMVGATTATEMHTKVLEKEKKALENTKKSLEKKKKALETQKSQYEKARDAIKSLVEWTEKYIKQQKNDEIKTLEKTKKKLDETVDAYKKRLQAQKELHDYQKNSLEKQNQVAKDALTASLLSLDDSASGRAAAKKAQDNLKKSQEDLHEYLYSHDLEAREKALDNYKTSMDKAYDKQIEILNEYLNDEVRLRRDATALIEKDSKALYSKLLDYCLKHTTTTKAEFDRMWSQAQSAMERYGTANTSVLDMLNNLYKRVYNVDSAIDTMTKNINSYEDRINGLTDKINDLKDAAINAKNAIAQASDYTPEPDKGKNNKVYFWVKYKGKEYKTAQKYDADTTANRLLAAPELLNQINKKTGANLPLSYVQQLLGVADKSASNRYRWEFTYNKKKYYSYNATRDGAVTEIRKQIQKDGLMLLDQNGFPVYQRAFESLLLNGALSDRLKWKHYAQGTFSAAGGLSEVNEKGHEIRVLNKGDGILTAKITKNLSALGENPAQFIADAGKKLLSNLIAGSEVKRSSLPQLVTASTVSPNVNIVIQGDATQSTINALKAETDKIVNKVMNIAIGNKRRI